MELNYDQYSFDDDYQDAILACLVDKPNLFMPYAGILNSAYFTGVERISTARALFAYWRKNSRFPSWETLQQIVYDAIVRTAEAKKESDILDYVDKLKHMDTGDAKDISRHCVEWARRRAIYLAVEKASRSFNDGEVPEDGFIPLFQEALKTGQNLDDMGYIIGPKDNDIAQIVSDYTAENYAISSGIPQLDDLLPSKGFEPGWLIVLLAPPKRYKTMTAINIGMNIARAGRPVFYYPCEISQQLASIRTLCNLTGRSIDFIRENPKGFTNFALDQAREFMGADMLIKGYPSKGASISGEIRTHAMASRQQLGLEPGAIIIDYAETVRSAADPKRTSEHRAQSEVYIEARALGAEMNCPVIMPDRCNRETVEKTVPNMASFQGAFEKAGIVDLGIGLCGSEKEYQEHIIRFFIFLNRHGEASQHFRSTVDPKTQQIGEWIKIPWNPEEDDENQGGGHGHKGNRYKRKKPPAELIEQ
jgi:replicative DNA helicase